MIFKQTYQNFFNRIRNEFSIVVCVLIAMGVLFLPTLRNENLELPILTMLLIWLIYMLFILLKAKTFVQEILIEGDRIKVVGYTFNTEWIKEFNILDSKMEIKSFGNGRGNVDYYLKIFSDRQKVKIPKSMDWDYQTLITILKEFKRIKGQELTYGEKALIKYMDKKS